MERSELERPSSGEAYVRRFPDYDKRQTIVRGYDDAFILSHSPNRQDSPSAPVQPLEIGFGVKGSK